MTPTVLAATYHVNDHYVNRNGSNSQAVAEFQGQYMNSTDLATYFRNEVPDAWKRPGDEKVHAFRGVPYRAGTGIEALLDIQCGPRAQSARRLSPAAHCARARVPPVEYSAPTPPDNFIVVGKRLCRFIMGVSPGVKTEFWEWPDHDFCADLAKCAAIPSPSLVRTCRFA